MTEQDSKLMRELTPDDLNVEAIPDEALDCVAGGLLVVIAKPQPQLPAANILVI